MPPEGGAPKGADLSRLESALPHPRRRVGNTDTTLKRIARLLWNTYRFMSTTTEQFLYSSAALFLWTVLAALQLVCVEKVTKRGTKIVSAAMLRACIVGFLSSWTFAYLETSHRWSSVSLVAILVSTMLVFLVVRMVFKLRLKISWASMTPSPGDGKSQ